jgi:hypothetical protein
MDNFCEVANKFSVNILELKYLVTTVTKRIASKKKFGVVGSLGIIPALRLRIFFPPTLMFKIVNINTHKTKFYFFCVFAT